MKKNIFILAVLALFSISIILIISYDRVNSIDIRRSLKLISVDFSSNQINTMVDYVNRNREGYKQMREFKLEENIKPSISFNLPYKQNFNYDYQFQIIKTELPEYDYQIAFLSIQELAYLIKNKILSSERLTRIYIDRIKKFDTKLNSVVNLMEEVAIEQSLRADDEIEKGIYRGILHGIPYGIKDIASYPNYPTTWGTEPYKDRIINEKAEVIKKLENAGAVMIAKLSSGSLARGDTWYNGRTKNPWDINQGSSGSSAGSASATSAGLVAFSIGTETLGSIISPSTRCGVTGLRPTYGTVSTNGFMTLSWSMDKVGPITRSASDAAIVFNVIKNKDSSKQRPLEINSIKNLKIGYLKNLFEKDTSRYAVNNFKIIEILKSKYKLDSLSLPNDYPFKVFDIILRSEAGAFFDKFLIDNLDSEMVLQDEKSRANSIRQSRLIPAVEYIQASRFRTKLISDIDSLFKNYDVILSPSFGKNQLLITNLTGHPAISIPNGFDKNSRPTSISLLSNYYEEHKLISLANEIQKLTDFHKKTPPGFKE